MQQYQRYLVESANQSYQLARIVCALLAWMIVVVPTSPAQAKPPQDRVAMLRRGVNITHWFRYPPSGDPDALTNYLSDTALDQLHGAGFTFLRIPVQPELIASSPRVLAALTKAVRRAEQRGFAVIVALAPTAWHLESNAGDRDALFAAWNRLGPALRGLPADRTFAELLNEPVFPNDAGAWARLQERLLAAVRTLLPSTTIILTGNDWGSREGPDSAHACRGLQCHLQRPFLRAARADLPGGVAAECRSGRAGPAAVPS